jgi:hypothetical protein
MITNAVATHTPWRPSAGTRCGESRSLFATDSLAAVVANSSTNASTPTETAIASSRILVVSASANPAARPAGSHATAIRSNGCAALPASSSSGSARDTIGPAASARVSRRRYSQPRPAQIATKASSQPRSAT